MSLKDLLTGKKSKKLDDNVELEKIVNQLIKLDIFNNIIVEENKDFHTIRMDYGTIYLEKKDPKLIFSFLVATSPSLSLFIVFNIQEVTDLKCKISDDYFIDKETKKILFGREASEAFKNKLIGQYVDNHHYDYLMSDDRIGIEC